MAFGNLRSGQLDASPREIRFNCPDRALGDAEVARDVAVAFDSHGESMANVEDLFSREGRVRCTPQSHIKRVKMVFTQGHPFKIVRTIVRLHAILMIYRLFVIGIRNKGGRDKAMNKPANTETLQNNGQIAILVWAKLQDFYPRKTRHPIAEHGRANLATVAYLIKSVVGNWLPLFNMRHALEQSGLH